MAENMTNTTANEESVMTKDIFKKTFWRSFPLQACFCYERMQNVGFAYQMVPALKKLYPDKKEASEALKRHLAIFNTTPAIVSFITGAAIAMEEKFKKAKDAGEECDEESINAVKAALMGPLAGIGDSFFWGTFRIIGDVFGKYGIEHTYVEMDDLDAVKAAIKPNTKMFFVETPTNPMMKVADIQALSEIAKSVGALMVVDNTFLTPYFQNPLKLGADIVTHSSTKYLGGHNDTLSGIVVVKDNEEIAEKIHIHIKSHGSQLAPMDCWLLLRGIKTLPVRMDRHNENAKKVAEWLRTQPKVKKVYYVGFEDHKDYATTIKQTRGFGGMISFTVDSFETVQKILRNVDMIMFAESLGGTETLITYPTTQTHEDTPKDVKEKLGITDCFLRMSVGIENVEDIIADLDRAMNS